jgi:hypothetical protein
MAQKKKSIDWGAEADQYSRGGSAPGPISAAPSGIPELSGDRVTILVATDLGEGENANHRLLRKALALKASLRAVGVQLRAQGLSPQEQISKGSALGGMGVDRLPAAVATIGPNRTVAIGERDSSALLTQLTQRLVQSPGEAMESFYDKEMRSKEAWTSAASGRDESEGIGGDIGDMTAEYQQAMQARNASGGGAPPTEEQQIQARAVGGDAETAAALSGDAMAQADGPTVSSSDAHGIHAAVAEVASEEDARDASLMAGFWESQTPSD